MNDKEVSYLRWFAETHCPSKTCPECTEFYNKVTKGCKHPLYPGSKARRTVRNNVGRKTLYHDRKEER